MQATNAYADYYCLNGIADEEDDAMLERLPVARPVMQAYASRTGTRRNLDAMRAAGWRLMVSATGVLRSEGMAYALNNGAWSAHCAGTKFDHAAFLRAVDKLGEGADWIVLPDIVAGGLASLDLSLKRKDALRGIPTPLMIAVQDGMQPSDVREHLSMSVGIFLGGSTAWKEATAMQWGHLARRRNCLLHVGRVNSQRRVAICAAAGASSFDGSSVSRYACTLPGIDAAKKQDDLFAAAPTWADS
jgi:hypothetical protein